jgi:hypothetical protein
MAGAENNEQDDADVGATSGAAPDQQEKEAELFRHYLDRADRPREGYWSAWATLAWVVSRDDKFVAAVQIYEQEHYADRGSNFSAAAWLFLGNCAGAIYGRTFTDAEADLREAIEADRIKGGVAKSLATGETGAIQRHRWLDWSRSFETVGLVLIPGYVSFRWPSDEVRRAFPSTRSVTLTSELPPGSNSEALFPRSQVMKKRWVRDRVVPATSIFDSCVGSVAPTDRTGAPGRPTPMHIIQQMMKERFRLREWMPTMTQEAEELVRLFNANAKYSELARVTAKSVRNSLGSLYRQLKREAETGPENN